MFTNTPTGQPPGTMITRVASHYVARYKKPTEVEHVPIETIKIGDKLIALNVSMGYLHRVGPVVTDVQTTSYDGELVSITTDSGLATRMSLAHPCVVLFGKDWLTSWVVYLMRRGNDYRIGITGARQMHQQGRLGLTMRVTQEKADAAWVLTIHKSRTEAMYHEMDTAWHYGIPSVLFKATASSILTQDQLDSFWREHGNNTEKANLALSDYGCLPDKPMWERGGKYLQARRPTSICASNLVDGMQMLPLQHAWLASSRKFVPGSGWQDIQTEYIQYSGSLYTLTVEKDHTYVADGIIVRSN